MKSNITNTIITALTLAVAFTVQAADRHVPADYPTIQAAVNAASNGDTIHIAPGVYPGQTLILEKNLTLIGRPGTILRATPDLTPIDPTSVFPAVVGIRRSDVTLRDLTFEGEHMADVIVDGFVGAYYYHAGGSIENCRFVSFRESFPVSNSNSSVALRFFNDLDNTPKVKVSVVGNTFVDNHIGIYLVGVATNPSIDFTITDNTIIGPGPATGVLTPYGIFIQQGTSGEVKRNSISNMSFVGGTAQFPFGVGVLALNQVTFPIGGVLEPILFEENTFRDNQMHIVLLRGDGSTITNNTIIGTAAGLRPAAILVSGENVTIAGNRFSQMVEGIQLMGDDPEWGTLFGFADDVQLIDNRFCDVANPITLQPQATATEQGTLLCPPEPVLGIAPAVLLTWLEFEDGYVVETAPAPDGPWTLLDATPLLEAGQTRVAVATTGEQQFFRLRQP